MSKKLMILGASYSQLPLYRAAARMGISTVAVSTPGDWPGFQEADEQSFTDISDPQAVIRAARECRADGIATCCLDTGVRAIGAVCDALGLVGLSEKAGEISSDKYKMKEAFMKAGVSCARHICIKSREELEEALEQLSFPVIIKAVDLMGSRGIYRSNTREEALSNYEKTMEETGKDYCLVEEFIEGEIFGTEAMMCKGELIYCLPNNIEAYEGHTPTPIGHSVPFDYEEPLGFKVREEVKKAIKAVGLDNCPVNCDCIRRGDQIFIIEITGRAGATCLPEMVGLYYGIDYYEAIVRLAMGMEVKSMFQLEGKKGQPNLSHIFISERAGILREIHNENAKAKDLVDLSFNVKPKDQIRKYENGRDRLGQVILVGDSLAACRSRLAQVMGKINIEFES